MALSEAVYEVADAARMWRRGVVMAFDGRDLVAYPHQTTNDIRQSFRAGVQRAVA